MNTRSQVRKAALAPMARASGRPMHRAFFERRLIIAIFSEFAVQVGPPRAFAIWEERAGRGQI
ncbi:hypothetical protein D9M73_289820 [compost metagenome]